MKNWIQIFLIDYFISFIASFSFQKKEFTKTEPIEVEDMCLKRPYHKTAEAYYFIPALRAKLFKVGDKYSFPSRCYKRNVVTLKEVGKDYMTFTLENEGKEGTFCSEIFFFHTSRINVFQMAAFAGKHEIKMKRMTKDDKDEVKLNGVKLYNFCNSLTKTIKSAYLTFKMFYGGLGSNPNETNPRYRGYIYKDQEKANLRHLDLFGHFTPERRNNTIVKFDKNIIKDGDFLAIFRMDGLEPSIMTHAGPPIAHSAVCSWHDGDLWVLEANSGAWPKEKDGIHETKWEEWQQLAMNFDFSVAHLPLKEEYRKNFNGTKAYRWFKDEIEGLPWGTRNFLFAHLDTPTNNSHIWEYPEVYELAFSVVDHFSKDYAFFAFGDALNHRLGTTNLTFPQIVAEAARKGKTIEELMAEPEPEGIVYVDGPNYVCSAFVVAFWEHGGLFGDLEILPTEFTPRDIYELDIYDKDFKRPQECIDDNKDLPYCQVLGKFIIYHENYGTIKPYSHMNERCPCVGPEFKRVEGC